MPTGGRAALAALLVALLASARAESAEGYGGGDEATSGAGPASEDEQDLEDEGDSAAFTLVVEHGDGWRCAASLVSLRTALTSARCARGRGPAPAPLAALTVRAPAAAPRALARRVTRVAFAAGAGAADLAVLELEAPLGSAAHALPILMATNARECAPPAACHAVRARRRASQSAHFALRIVDAALVAPAACARAAPHWLAPQDSVLCLRGDTLCASDSGAGVVCDGKLCGVVSRSLGAPGPGPGPGGGEEGCGALHVAHGVARWRRFLHCAHTLRACGSGGDCAHLCTERRLLEEEAQEAAPAPLGPDAPPASVARAAGARDPPHRTSSFLVDAEYAPQFPAVAPEAMPLPRVSVAPSTASPSHPSRTAPSASAAPAGDQVPPAPRSSIEFEPNRADFKAGEYGDNAAEYGGDEPPAATPPPPARTALTAPPPPAGELAARVSPAAAPPASRAPPRRPPRALPAALLVLRLLLYYKQ